MKFIEVAYKIGPLAPASLQSQIGVTRLLWISASASYTKDQALTYINMTPLQRENQNKITSLAKNSTEGKLDMGNLFLPKCTKMYPLWVA